MNCMVRELMNGRHEIAGTWSFASDSIANLYKSFGEAVFWSHFPAWRQRHGLDLLTHLIGSAQTDSIFSPTHLVVVLLHPTVPCV